jgi:uncharacterized RDD family membrane protein YckC
MSEEVKRAGLLVRSVARVLDFILIAAVVEIVPKAGFFAGLAYLLIGDGLFDGQSLGKKLIGIRAVSLDTHTPCTLRDSILRNCTFGIGYLLYKMLWFGWIAMVIIVSLELLILLGSRERMRIGDEIAKTVVIDISQTEKQEV